MAIYARTENAEKRLNIDSLLVEVITREMRQLFGEIPAGVFFTHLERKHGLLRSEIPHKPEVFMQALRMVLGSASPMFERVIVKQLCSNLGLESQEKEEYRFIECMRKVRSLP